MFLVLERQVYFCVVWTHIVIVFRCISGFEDRKR
jgi:hypothetical protein